MSGFDRFLTTVLDQAQNEARTDGSPTVEAQHLLLAIAGGEEPSTRQALTAVGLDHEALRTALDREFEQSLRAAGVSVGVADIPPASPAREGSPALGSSVKLALERGLGANRKRNPRPAHLLLGIVQAPVGTVPRALALAGVDRSALVDRVRQMIDAGE